MLGKYLAKYYKSLTRQLRCTPLEHVLRADAH